jgi:hypothetical protein
MAAARATSLPTKNQVNHVPLEEPISQRSPEALLEARIREGAHEIYLENGARDGFDLEDWLQAESEICASRNVEPNLAPERRRVPIRSR